MLRSILMLEEPEVAACCVTKDSYSSSRQVAVSETLSLSPFDKFLGLLAATLFLDPVVVDIAITGAAGSA
jgi:hypothetical protein